MEMCGCDKFVGGIVAYKGTQASLSVVSVAGTFEVLAGGQQCLGRQFAFGLEDFDALER